MPKFALRDNAHKIPVDNILPLTYPCSLLPRKKDVSIRPLGFVTRLFVESDFSLDYPEFYSDWSSGFYTFVEEIAQAEDGARTSQWYKLGVGGVLLKELSDNQLEHLLSIIEQGAKKYEAFGWARGLTITKLTGPFCRHYRAMLKDPNSVSDDFKCLHSMHALWNYLMMGVHLALIKNGILQMDNVDDRPNIPYGVPR